MTTEEREAKTIAALQLRMKNGTVDHAPGCQCRLCVEYRRTLLDLGRFDLVYQ
jgi:hypothetical protein